MNLESLAERIQTYYPDTNLDVVTKAYHFAKAAHEGQFRDSGEPFFLHPFEVSSILTDMELDMYTIAAGLLHDVLEDTAVTPERLRRNSAITSSPWWTA